MESSLHTELWTSWASLLRSYAAAHGLNSKHHAVVEVSADEITLRVNDRWLSFTSTTMQHSAAAPVPFTLTEDGHPQTLSSVSQDTLPLSLVFLFDLTDTVHPVLQHLADLWSYDVLLKEIDPATDAVLKEHTASPRAGIVQAVAS